MPKTCATDAEFDKWIRHITLQEIVISSYFDIGEYGPNQIKYFIEDAWIALRPDSSVVQTVFIKKNRLQLDDNIFGLFNTKTDNFFYQVSRKDTFLSDDDMGPGQGIYLY